MSTALRHSAYPVEPLFLERWSPRAFDSSSMSDEDFLTIMEAARWAPSAFNAQPWRFVYAKRDDATWAGLLDLLIPFNASWAKNAAVLIYVVSDTLMTQPDGATKPSHSHSFDSGAAWALLALQATRLGYRAHGMTGVDFDRARTVLGVPERYRVEAAVVIGRQADKSILPEALQTREAPSHRRPLDSLLARGRFTF